MGLSDGRKSFPIGLAVLIQYRSVTARQPASHPASHVAVAITLNAKASSLKILQLLGDLVPQPPYRGSAPGPRCGTCVTQTPVVLPPPPSQTSFPRLWVGVRIRVGVRARVWVRGLGLGLGLGFADL